MEDVFPPNTSRQFRQNSSPNNFPPLFSPLISALEQLPAKANPSNLFNSIDGMVHRYTMQLQWSMFGWMVPLPPTTV
jgi:hypothetical protein